MDIDGLSESEMQNAMNELHAIFQWEDSEEKKIIDRLEQEGVFLGGLDTTNIYLDDLHKERNRKIKELQNKYLSTIAKSNVKK